MLKIVYFDEGSAIDYLDISNGGNLSQTTEKKKQKEVSGSAKLEIDVNDGVIFKALAPFIKTDLSLSTKGGVSALGETLVNTTISNSVLSEYLEKANKDNSITKVNNCNLQAYQNSISYMKMYTPYTKMLKIDHQDVDITMLDEVLEKSKGYYELTLKNDTDRVVRFNINAFRNNYNLMDLTRMKLKLYLVKVGTIDLHSLNIKHEFSISFQDQEVSGETLITSDKHLSNDHVDLFDVVLAGIE
ncbi:hypothetical protein E1160_06560 [Rhodospirillaceae bacterium RKSG073]|nr:hypothetical protein [Curvivirga aplysinae]